MSAQGRRVSACQRVAWLSLACASMACGGVAQEQHASPAAHAGAPALADAGVLDATPEENDAAPTPDASSDSDAGAAKSCPTDTVTCCDRRMGVTSLPICVDGYTQCGVGLELWPVERACRQTPEACRVASAKELDGKACSSVAASCVFGGGCSSCHCECQESTLLWHCECTPC